MDLTADCKINLKKINNKMLASEWKSAVLTAAQEKKAPAGGQYEGKPAAKMAATPPSLLPQGPLYQSAARGMATRKCSQSRFLCSDQATKIPLSWRKLSTHKTDIAMLICKQEDRVDFHLSSLAHVTLDQLIMS